MSVTTERVQVRTISGTLASDPARWTHPICADTIYSRTEAEREIIATASAVLGRTARIVAHHNHTGTWAVDIERDKGQKVYHLYWSSVTTDNNGGQFLVQITRGEALVVLMHELFHVLFTDNVTRPDYCHPAHWEQFFSVVNMTEDVRIEDAGENEVPVFGSLRRVENERLLLGNEAGYSQMDSIRHVCLALYSARCADASIASRFVDRLSTAEEDAFDACLAEFHEACDQRSTQALVDKLEPVYDALLPFLPPVGGGKPDDGEEGGEPGDDESGEGESGEGESGEGESGDGGTGGTSPQGNDDESGDDESGNDDDSGDDESGNDDDSGGDESGNDDDSGDDESGNGGDDQPGGESGGNNTSHGGVTGGNGELGDDPVRPDRTFGDWDTPRDDSGKNGNDRIDQLMDGQFIPPAQTGEGTGTYDHATSVASRSIRAQLNRVLQHNADGSYAGRKRRGSFDVKRASKLSLGDTRVFRTKQGPRGARDFSLVMLLDASSSVRGACGRHIAQAGYAIKRASDQIHGLDVAVAAYGGHGPIGAIPFDATADQWSRLPDMLYQIAGGHGGGTDETNALVWARGASVARGAEQPLIVVLTDGHPNDRFTVREEVDKARRLGILTGGIGVARRTYEPVVPDYHEFYATTRDLSSIPSVLAELLRRMMKAR